MKIPHMTFSVLETPSRHDLDRRLRWVGLIGTWTIVVVLVVIAALSCACTRAPARLPDPPAPIGFARDRLEQEAATVRLETTCVYGSLTRGMTIAGHYGSGVLISRRALLTAGHVVECVPSATYGEGTAIVQIYSADDSRVRGSVEVIDHTRDVARVRADADVAIATRPMLGAPARGDAVCSSYAWPAPRGHHCGAVVERRAGPDRGGNLDHTAESIPGNSGAGVYDLEGRLVGVVVTLHYCDLSLTSTCGGGASSVPAAMVVP